MAKQCYSDIECKIIKDQIERRAKFRQEFLKKRTDPYLHSKEAGYVFDESMQRFITLKAYQVYYFRPCLSAAIKAFLTITPMVAYGCLIWNDRNELESQYRCGKVKYRDRIFKFT